MKPLNAQRQTGAVLLVALVMLLVLTLLAVGSMRNVTLETRLTANRALDTQLVNSAEAGLREAEFRYYGPGNIAEKLSANPNHCSADNKLKANGLNIPCILAIKPDALLAFIETPQTVAGESLEDVSAGSLLWMPNIGTDPSQETEASSDYDVTWNSMLVGENTTGATNAEYGAILEGQGTYFYLNNSSAGDSLYLQSTHANIYLGINN